MLGFQKFVVFISEEFLTEAKEVDDVTDSKIIDFYWERSEQAIKESSSKYGKYCFSIAYNILSNREDSEECVSDTWLKAWNAMPPQRPNCLSAFFAKITRNLVIQQIQS